MYGTAATIAVSIACVLHLSVYLLYTFPADESVWTEIALCELNQHLFSGIDPFINGCAELQTLHADANTKTTPVSFTTIIQGALTPGQKYTAYLVGNTSLLQSGVVAVGGTLSLEGGPVLAQMSNIQAAQKHNTMPPSTGNNAMHQEMRRRRLLKGGSSSSSWGRSSKTSQSTKPSNVRTSSGNVFHRRYRRYRSRNYYTRRRRISRSQGSYPGTMFGDTPLSEEQHIFMDSDGGDDDLSSPFHANVRSWRRLPFDRGGSLCESMHQGCARTMQGMSRLAITPPTIIIQSNPKTNRREVLRLDWDFLTLQQLTKDSTAADTADVTKDVTADTAAAHSPPPPQLYVMFVTNDAGKDFLSTACFWILALVPLLGCLVVLSLHPLFRLMSSEERQSLVWSGPSECSTTLWKALSLGYYGIVLLFVVASVMSLFNEVGCNMTLFLFITTAGSAILASFDYGRTAREAIRRHTLEPWNSATDSIGDKLTNNNARWRCEMDVTSMHQAIQYYERTAVVPIDSAELVEIDDNDLTSWAADASIRLGTIKYLNLSNNDLTNIYAVGALTNVEMIDLHSNELAMLSNVSSRTLTWLRVSDNNIKSLRGFGPMPMLDYLDISSNELSSLKGIVTATKNTSVMPSLRALDISNNNLSSNGGELSALSTLEKLEALNLDDNDLTDVDEILRVVFSLPKLKYLSCYENDLSDSDEEKLERECQEKGIRVDV
jgi:hypothetical protein